MNGRRVTGHRPPRLRKAIAVMAACFLTLPDANAAGQMPSDAAPRRWQGHHRSRRASYIEGEGALEMLVELVSDDVALGVATVAQSGLWRIACRVGEAGTYRLRAEARLVAAGPRAAGDEIRVAILGTQRAVELHGRGRFSTTRHRTRRSARRRQRAEQLADGAGLAFDDMHATQNTNGFQAAPTAVAASDGEGTD